MAHLSQIVERDLWFILEATPITDNHNFAETADSFQMVQDNFSHMIDKMGIVWQIARDKNRAFYDYIIIVSTPIVDDDRV